MTRFTNNTSISAVNDTEARLRRVEERLEFYDVEVLPYLLPCRLRTDITVAPTSSTDTNQTTRLNDVVILTNSQYIVINDSGTLAWRKITLDTF